MPWYVAVYELLLQVSLAGCVLLGVATVAIVLLREPARQIRVIELAMWGLLALPLIVLIPGYPRVALLPASEEPAPLKVASLVQPPALPRGPAPIDSTLPTPAELAPSLATTSPRAATPTPASTPPLVSTPSSADTVALRPRESSVAPLPVRVWQFSTDYRLWIVCSYLAGTGILLAWSLIGLIALRRLVRSSQPADAATRSALHAIAGDTSSRVQLLVSPRAAQPCAFGWMRPTIVLPQALIDSADPAALRFALAHEWSHVSRGDVGVWTISGFARLLHFPQPLLWLLRQHLRRAQDYLADSAAAGAGTPEDYAEFLTSFSQSFKRPRLAPGLGIVSRRSDLHRRVVMLVEKQGSLERTPPRRWNAAILIAGLLAVAAVASLRAEPQQATAQPPLLNATTDLEKPTSDDAIPKELSPERIRDTASQRQMIELVVLADPQLQKLRWELEQFVRAKERTPRDRVPNTELYTRIMMLEQHVKQREAEVRVAAQKSLMSHHGGDEMEQIIDAVIDLDPTVARLKQQLGAIIKRAEELRKELRGDPTPDVELQKRVEDLVAERDRKILETEEAMEQRRAELRGTLHEAQTKRFLLGDDALAQNQPTSATRRTPFSGKIRPGDILNIEMVGGFPGGIIPPRTVEPDGNIALSPAYGIERIAVGGKSLIEAGTAIATRLKGMLKDPRVLVTYAGHDPDVVSADEAAKSASAPIPIAWEAEAKLEPLDTIEIRLPVKELTLRENVDGKLREVRTSMGSIDDVYVIEPDGSIALPWRYGRVNIGGLTETDAGNAIRKHLTQNWMPRTSLPQVSVRKRGRAVFSADQQPSTDGRIRPGDSLLIGDGLQSNAFNYQVTPDGNLPEKAIAFYSDPQSTVPPLHVAGLSLAEAQDAIAKDRKSQVILVTIGGWHEEADPQMIDRLGESNDPRVQQLERELQQIKTLLQGQR